MVYVNLFQCKQSFHIVVQKGRSEMTDAERKRMQSEIKELQKIVSVSIMLVS